MKIRRIVSSKKTVDDFTVICHDQMEKMTTHHYIGGQDVKIQSPKECQIPKSKTDKKYHEKGKAPAVAEASTFARGYGGQDGGQAKERKHPSSHAHQRWAAMARQAGFTRYI